MTFNLTLSSPTDPVADIVQTLRALRDDERSIESKRDFALRQLETTPSAAVRNAAALALSDLKDAGSIPAIVDVLMKPGIANAAGTLLFAIEELGGDLPLAAFVHVIAQGSYEARQQALDLLFDHRVVEHDPGQLEHRLAALEQFLASTDKARAADAREAQAFLRAGHEAASPEGE